MTSAHGTIPLNDPRALPLLGHEYRDSEGRRLLVHTLEPGNLDGRQVQGYLTSGGLCSDLEGDAAYATDLKTWGAVWRDRAPRWRGRT